MACDFNGTSSKDEHTTATVIADTMTICAWVRADTTGEGGIGRVISFSESELRPVLEHSPSANRLRFRHTWSGSTASWDFPCTDAVWHAVALRYDRTSTSNDPVARVDFGAVTVTELVAPSGTASANATGYCIGNQSAQSATWNGAIAYVQVFNVILTAGEMDQALRRPGSVRRGLTLFRPLRGAGDVADLAGNKFNGTQTDIADRDGPPVGPIWGFDTARSFVVAAGGAFTLAADPGAYALTGLAAGLRAGRQLAAAAGSYALSGQAANLLFGRTLAAVAGSYAYTGQSATFEYDRVLAAASGSYTVSGQASNLLRGLKVAADAGAYALTGQAAGLAATRTLTAAAGSYALTGQAAGLFHGHVLSAAFGAYLYTGQSATLTYTQAGAYELDADPGSYALTGQSASLLATRRLAAAAGSYAQTGQTAVLAWGHRLVADTGSYAVTGQTATLTAARTMTAVPGAYTLSGVDATLTYGSFAVVSRAAVTTTGEPDLRTTGDPSLRTTG